MPTPMPISALVERRPDVSVGSGDGGFVSVGMSGVVVGAMVVVSLDEVLSLDVAVVLVDGGGGSGGGGCWVDSGVVSVGRSVPCHTRVPPVAVGRENLPGMYEESVKAMCADVLGQ
jgi:hypothetical protein